MQGFGNINFSASCCNRLGVEKACQVEGGYLPFVGTM
jgi:hypothetical protein